MWWRLEIATFLLCVRVFFQRFMQFQWRIRARVAEERRLER